MVKAIPFAIIQSPLVYLVWWRPGILSPYFCRCEAFWLSIESSHLNLQTEKIGKTMQLFSNPQDFSQLARTIQANLFELARLDAFQETGAKLDARKIGVLACLFSLRE
jgi:hypothetical protein